MELIDLNAEIRKESGKIASRALRKNNLIPAVMYGANTDAMSISVDDKVFAQMIRENGSSGLFIKLKINDDSKQTRTVFLKDFQMDTFKLKYLHADFQEINLDDKVAVVVPVEAVGDCPGVKAGGMIQVIRRELEIWCRPVDVPDSVQIDVSELEIGDAVHVEEIDLGKDVEIPHDVDFTVVTIVPPVSEEAEDVDEELDEKFDVESTDDEDGAEETDEAA